jgi:hypothetical protein
MTPDVVEMAANSTVIDRHRSRTNGLKLPATTETRGHGVNLPMERILQHLREGRNLGPLSILVFVLLYSLLSPHLPAPIHDYIYHIAH